jgi:hypothetical protein
MPATLSAATGPVPGACPSTVRRQQETSNIFLEYMVLLKHEAWSLLTGDLQLRQAQTEAPGSPATIPRGDGIGTAHLTRPSPVRILKTTISTTADVTTTESGGISA